MKEIRDKKAIRHIENKQQNDRSPFLSVITSNVSGLNSLIIRQRSAGCKKKTGNIQP